ncbi:hypothetical protein CLAIMM_04709, partial [Cladophialophora immunda]
EKTVESGVIAAKAQVRAGICPEYRLQNVMARIDDEDGGSDSHQSFNHTLSTITYCSRRRRRYNPAQRPRRAEKGFRYLYLLETVKRAGVSEAQGRKERYLLIQLLGYSEFLSLDSTLFLSWEGLISSTPWNRLT